MSFDEDSWESSMQSAFSGQSNSFATSESSIELWCVHLQAVKVVGLRDKEEIVTSPREST